MPVGHPGGRQQVPDVARGDRRLPTAAVPGGDDPPRTGVRRDEPGQLVDRLAGRAHQQQPERTEQAAEEEPHHHERQGARGPVGEQRVERRGPLPAAVARRLDRVRAYAPVGGLDVEHDCVGDDDRTVPGPGGAPAEVDVVAEQRQSLVEAERLQHRAADQHPGGVHREHVPQAVVLALVVLAALQAGLATAGAADRDADLEQAAQRGPLPELGAQEVDRRALLRDGEQLLERVGGGGAVVVQQPDPLVARRRPGVVGVDRGSGGREGGEGEGDRGAEGAGRRRGQDRVVPEPVPEQLRALVRAAGVHGDHLVGGPGLAGQSVEHRRQPARSLVADQQRRHRRAVLSLSKGGHGGTP